METNPHDQSIVGWKRRRGNDVAARCVVRRISTDPLGDIVTYHDLVKDLAHALRAPGQFSVAGGTERMALDPADGTITATITYHTHAPERNHLTLLGTIEQRR